MKKILFIILLMCVGLISYAQFPVLIQEATTTDIVTPEQDWHNQDSASRVYVMTMWTKGKPAFACRPDKAVMKQATVEWFYRNIQTSINYAMQLMKGEVLITPAVYDDEGEVLKQAVYNTIPKDATDLRNQIRLVYDDFYKSEVDYYISYFIILSGCGDWETFKNVFK